jgi:hypothetical protein
VSDPTLRASIVLSDSTIYLEFTESLAWSSYEEGDFTLRINGSTSLSLYRMSSSGNHIYLRPQTPIYRGVTDVDISYSAFFGMDSLESVGGGQLTTFYRDNVQNISDVNPLEAQSITRVDSSPTNRSTVEFYVVFSESVLTGTVNAWDFQLNFGGTATGQVGTPYTYNGSAWYVPVVNISGQGTLGLGLNSSGTGIVSSANPPGFSTPKSITERYVSGESYSIDTVAPSTPNTPNLSVSSDTGNVDNITADHTPTITGTAESGSSVRLYDTDGTTLVGVATATGGVWLITSSALTDGVHFFTVKASDDVGNVSAASNSLVVTIDTVAPTSPVVSLLGVDSDTGILDGITSDTTPTVMGTAESGSTVTLYSTDETTVLGMTTASGGIWSITPSNLLQGTYVLTVKAVDNAGNVSTLSNGLFVQIDATAPAAPNGPALVVNSDTGSSVSDRVTADATPTLTGIAELESTVTLYDTDGTTQLGSAVATGGVWSITSSQLSEGEHTLTVRATDLAGNTGLTSNGLVIFIDTVAPAGRTAPILEVNSDTGITDGISADATPTIMGTAEAGSTVTLYDSDGRTQLGATVAINGLWSITSGELSEGAHALTVKVTDIAGNTGIASTGLFVTIDTTPPGPLITPYLDLSSDTGLIDGVTADATPTFTGTAEIDSIVTLYDTDGATQLGSTVAIDGRWSITSRPLSEGAHTLTATATDLVGQTSFVSNGLAITIDTISPIVVSSDPTDGVAGVTVSPEMRIRFSEVLNANSDLTNVYLKNARDEVVAVAIWVDQSGDLTIVPTETLVRGRTYFLTWEADSLFDLAGNSVSAMSTADALTFTTVVGDNNLIQGRVGLDRITLTTLVTELTSFDFSPDGRGFILVGPEGTDTFYSIEQLRFVDGLFTPEELRTLFTPTVKFRSFQNGVEVLAQPTFFTGPSSLNLHYQLIDTAPGTVLVGSTLNDFIVLQGGGNKAVDGGLGDDVIDGGTGSTFVSGGGGSNTFFLDGRAPGVSWSTITDFRLGVDFTTIWGWKAGVSRVAALEANGGAAGYSGLTLHFENLLPDLAPQGSLNQNLNSITFSHKSLADFGVASLNELNEQIATGASSHFTVGETNDIYGQHGYLFIS